MTLQEATAHTNTIRLHWIELKQTLEEVIYRWDAACKIVLLLDSITADHLRAVAADGADVYVLSCGMWRQSGLRNGSLAPNQWGTTALNPRFIRTSICVC